MRLKNKTLFLFLAVVLSMAFMCGCGEQSSQPSWWSEDQVNTISSIKQIDEDGNLYEMNYTADYNLDDVIKAGTYPNDVGYKSIQDTLLPDSEFELPKNQSTGGCSSFATTAENGHPIFARNYDWYKTNSASLVVHTAPKDGYKSVSVADPAHYGLGRGGELTDEIKEGFLYSPFCALEGVNEKGLAAGLMMLNINPVKQDTGNQQITSSMMIRVILDKAANVSEAIELFKQYDVVSGAYDQGINYHWLVADAEGNRVVLEYVDNELVVNEYPIEVQFNEETGSSTVNYPQKDTGYIMSTNFYVTKGAQDPSILGDNGYWRYQTLEGKLRNNPNPTLEEAMTYLDAIHYGLQDKDTALEITKEGYDATNEDLWDWISIDSSVYDLIDKTLTMCVQQDFSKSYDFSIDY